MEWIKTSDKLPEDDRAVLFIENEKIVYGCFQTEKYSGDKIKYENEDYNCFVDLTSWIDYLGFKTYYKIEDIKYWCELPDMPK